MLVLQKLSVDLIYPLVLALDAVIQPGIRFGVGLPLAGAAGLCAGKGAALAVLLYLDLPAFLIWKPSGGIGSSAHKNTHLQKGTL